MMKKEKGKSRTLIEHLKIEETRLHSLIKSDKRVIIYLSPDYKIIEFNQEAEQLYGRNREEVLGENYLKLSFPKPECERVAAILRQVLTGGPDARFEGRVATHDRRATVLSWNVIRIECNRGEPIGLLLSGRDITNIRRQQTLIKAFVKKRAASIKAYIQLVKSKISEQKYAEEVLRKTEFPQDLKLKPPRLPLIQIDKNGTITSWAHQAEIAFGWTKQEVLGKSLNETIIPLRFQEKHKNGLHHFLSKDEDAIFKRMLLPAIHRNGKEFPAELILWQTKSEKSYVFNIFVRSLTANKKVSAKKDLAATAINAANEAIIITDLNGWMFSVNQAFSRMTGYSAEEAIGKNPRILQSGRHDKAFYQAMWDKLISSGHWSGEIWNRRKNGEIYPEWLSITAVKDEQGNVTQYIGFFIDITQRKAVEEKLYRRANYDNLTGLPNRDLFRERLQQVIRLSKRNQKKSALLFVDLDEFKRINDTLGHLAGDQILNEVGQRMLGCVREADTVARYSGDEFLVLLSDIPDRKDSMLVANKMIKKLASPFHINDRDVSISASIGIALIPDDGEDITALLKNADEAMYQAKATGRNSFHFFHQKEKVPGQSLVPSDIQRGIDNQEFVVYYQPIIDLLSSKTIALEALIRWEHPERGLILPDEFIPVAEKSGMIVELGEWVLTKACKQTKDWHDHYQYDGAISVNLSSRQIKEGDFGKVLTDALEESGLRSQSLTLEVEGDLLLEKSDKPSAQFEKIKALGVKVAIHDFGSGYSSLSYLSKYSIDHLKINKPFIQNVTADPQKNAFVKAIVSMGHYLNIKVLAMGIETDRDLSFLKGLGCDAGQGYFLTKPLSATDYEAVLKKREG